MRKKIPAGIIIFASLSSIMIYKLLFFFGLHGFTVLFSVLWIITIPFLLLLKNWARISYIIIHLLLASITFIIYILFLCFGLGIGGSMSLNDHLIFLLPFSYFLIAYMYFLRSDTAKLFKQ